MQYSTKIIQRLSYFFLIIFFISCSNGYSVVKKTNTNKTTSSDKKTTIPAIKIQNTAKTTIPATKIQSTAKTTIPATKIQNTAKKIIPLPPKTIGNVQYGKHWLDMSLKTQAELSQIVEQRFLDNNIIWESADSTIATVNEKGTVSAIKTGVTFIKILSPSRNLKTQIQINVYTDSERGGGFLAEDVSRETGWFDVNKKYRAHLDKNLCWAATDSNIIDWWQSGLDDATLTHIGAPHGQDLPTGNPNKFQSRVFQYFAEYSRDNPHHIDKGLNWYFTNGFTIPLPEDPARRQKTDERKALYSQYFGNETRVAKRYDKGREWHTRNEFDAIVRDAFSQGYVMGLEWSGNGSAHAITCWGYELANSDPERRPINDLADFYRVKDEHINSRNGNKIITHLYMTDSDDAKPDNQFEVPLRASQSDSLFRAVLAQVGGELKIGTGGRSFKTIDAIVVLQLRRGELSFNP